MVKKVGFKVAHLDLMDLREQEMFSGLLDNMQVRRGAQRMEELKTAVTLVYNGIILGVAGYIPLCDGVCELLIIPTIHQREHGLVFAREVKLLFLRVASKFRRVQAVAINDTLHNRWLSWLGMTKEGCLRKFGLNGEDLDMWAKVED